MFVYRNIFQSRTKVAVNTINDLKTPHIPAHDSRTLGVQEKPKKNDYEDYCLTKVKPDHVHQLAQFSAIYNLRVALNQLQTFLTNLMKLSILVMTFTSFPVEALLRKLSSQMINQGFPCFQFWETS